MQDPFRFLDRVPLRWRFATATAVPLAIGFGLYLLVGLWALAVSAAVAVLLIWILAGRQSRYFFQTATGILRTRAIDRHHRLADEGPAEQRRIANAVNRLADNVERTLAESDRNRRYHETILNELTAGIMVVDEAGNMQYANPAAAEMLGFDLPLSDPGPTPLASKVAIFEINEAVTQSATTGETVHRDVEIYDTHRHIEVIARGVPPEESGIARAVAIVNDRTDEIRQGVSMREFVANASHELRTPIASIQASVETLKLGKQLDNEIADQFLDRIDDGAHRMASLVNELMDLTLLETGRMALNLNPTAPEELINAVLDSHGPISGSSAHHVDVDIDDDLPEFHVDAPKIERALGNLLVNAQKFTPEDGRISIACRSDGDHVVIEVADTGLGIDSEELPHIFERFYKSQRALSDRSGFGLGLAIAKNIIELHEGTVEATSMIGEGSTFSVRLPIAGSKNSE